LSKNTAAIGYVSADRTTEGLRIAQIRDEYLLALGHSLIHQAAIFAKHAFCPMSDGGPSSNLNQLLGWGGCFCLGE
jgi:hypothetical protein